MASPFLLKSLFLPYSPFPPFFVFWLQEQIAKDLLSGEEEEETQSSADDLTPSVTSHDASDLFPSQTGCKCGREYYRPPS